MMLSSCATGSTDMQRLTLRDITPARMSEFLALESIPEEQRAALLAEAVLQRVNPGEFLFKGRPPTDCGLFLVQGELEVQECANVRYKVYAGGIQARNALGDLLSPGATLRALDDVTVLSIPLKAIAEARSRLELEALTIEYSPVSAVAREEPRVDRKPADDWMTRIRQSPLLADFSPSDIQRFFMETERVDHEAGDEIVTMGCRGDYFYVLFEGAAEVLTDPAGPYAGARFDLVPGDHFGEEALIADTPRNATVRMKTNGAVGRLERTQFDAIFRQALVQVIDLEKARSFLAGSGQQFELLDIRPEAQCPEGHRAGARSLPIRLLRKSLGELARKCTYLVDAQAGRWSELAVFLLRQSGLNAYLLRD
jgi:rhodanese-related sulfurtransferase